MRGPGHAGHVWTVDEIKAISPLHSPLPLLSSFFLPKFIRQDKAVDGALKGLVPPRWRSSSSSAFSSPRFVLLPLPPLFSPSRYAEVTVRREPRRPFCVGCATVYLLSPSLSFFPPSFLLLLSRSQEKDRGCNIEPHDGTMSGAPRFPPLLPPLPLCFFFFFPMNDEEINVNRVFVRSAGGAAGRPAGRPSRARFFFLPSFSLPLFFLPYDERDAQGRLHGSIISRLPTTPTLSFSPPLPSFLFLGAGWMEEVCTAMEFDLSHALVLSSAVPFLPPPPCWKWKNSWRAQGEKRDLAMPIGVIVCQSSVAGLDTFLLPFLPPPFFFSLSLPPTA